MRQEFLITLYYLDPNFFPALWGPCKLRGTAAVHAPEKTRVVRLLQRPQGPGPLDAPELTPNLFWFIQDPKDRHPPHSTLNDAITSGVPWPLTELGSGNRVLGLLPRAGESSHLAETGIAVVQGLSFNSPI